MTAPRSNGAAEPPVKPGVFARARALVSSAFEDRTPWVLAGIALLVYLPGLTWGLPHATSEVGIRGWDVDSVTAIGVLSEFHNLLVEAKPDWWVAYPLFHYFVLAAVSAPYLAFLVMTGGLSAPQAGYPYGFSDPEGALAILALFGRAVTVLMGAGTIGLVYVAGKLAWDRRAGIVAAVLVMPATPVVYYSRTGNLDVPVLFWMAAGVAVMAWIYRDGLDVRRGALLGGLAAIAVATKDQAYGAWVPALVLVCLFHGVALGRRSGWWSRPTWAPIGALIAGGAVTYAFANGVVFAPGRFVRHVEFLLDYENTFYNVAQLGLTHPKTIGGYTLLARDIVRAVVVAGGLPLVLIGVVALAHPSTRSKWTVLLLSMLLGYAVLVIAPISHMQYRYALLPVVIVSLLAGRLLATGWTAGGGARSIAVAAGVLAIGWSGTRAVDLTYQMLGDAREEAGAWLQERAVPGDLVGYFGAVSQLPRIPVGVPTLRLDEQGMPPSRALARTLPKYVIVASDWSSEPGTDRSAFLPEEVLAEIQSGAHGYRLALDVEPDRLLGSELPYLVFVNPRVRVYERSAVETASTRGLLLPDGGSAKDSDGSGPLPTHLAPRYDAGGPT